MKRILKVILVSMLVFSLVGCKNADSEAKKVSQSSEAVEDVQDETAETVESAEGTDTEESTEQTDNAESNEASVEEVVGFKVDGSRLLDANGNEFVMRGVNHPHSWYANKDIIALPAIAEAGCNTVRIVCGSGIQYSKDSVEMLSALISKCKKLKMVVVLEVHDITGKDDIASIEQVTDYWIEVKDALIGNEAYVILNIANEWVGKWDSKIWRDGYTAAIPRLREAGIKNTIMVDAGGWGQYGKSIADYGTEVLASDPDGNTMFAVHMYGSAGKDEASIESNITGATNQGLCIIVGEFGHTHSDGDVNEAYIMQYCNENNIGYLGWSWKGNGGGVEYLDIALEWDGSELSPDWGEILINGENGIKETSKVCSIFE